MSIVLFARYVAETGDVVVGRVTETAQKKWKVDLNGRQDAQLMLSAINLAGGVQRRRTHEDELNMRTYFSENDVISSEVQTVLNDGTVALHTRNMKYGKVVSDPCRVSYSGGASQSHTITLCGFWPLSVD